VIGTLLFVLAFVLLGLTVVFVAFSGGPRGAAQRRPGQGSSLGARRALGIVVGVVIIGFGLAVPTLVGVANGTNKAKQGPGGIVLTASAERGRQLFARNCSTCHTLSASNAVGKVGPNLDVLHPPKALVLDAIAKGRAQGRGQMPAQLLDGAEAQDVAAYVAAVSGR
jgi:mono/diheme cytochrome c family protein